MKTTPPSTSRSSRRGLRWFDHIARRLLLRRLHELRGGAVRFTDEVAATLMGDNSGNLHATIDVRDAGFYRQAVMGGNLAVAESYLCGDWDCDDLTALFRLFLRNQSLLASLEGRWSRAASWAARLGHLLRSNTRRGSCRNIADHYDLGNDFFALFLDPTLAYSSGIFPTPDSTLEDASREKMDRVCRKLALSPRDRLLEIGTGWGALAIHAAEQYGCRVTTTTISRQQFALARERVEGVGLQRQVTLLDCDYRDLNGAFDKLVSVEMIEAVGHRYLDTYLAQCSRLLTPQGSMLLQAILIPDQRYERYRRSVDFIQRYIFPGGCLPSLGAILGSVARVTDLRLVHLEDFAPHYARTLRTWREQFHVNRDRARDLGYPEELLRRWEYYLSYCEAAFEERVIGVAQLVLDKPGCRRDPLAVGGWAVGRPETTGIGSATDGHMAHV